VFRDGRCVGVSNVVRVRTDIGAEATGQQKLTKLCSAGGGGSSFKGGIMGLEGSGSTACPSPLSLTAPRTGVAAVARNDRSTWAVTLPAEVQRPARFLSVTMGRVGRWEDKERSQRFGKQLRECQEKLSAVLRRSVDVRSRDVIACLNSYDNIEGCRVDSGPQWWLSATVPPMGERRRISTSVAANTIGV